MNESLLLIVIVYALFTALLLVSLIKSNISLIVKGSLIIAAIAFYSFSYFGWKEAQGWPTTTDLPDRFFFHHGLIHEPDKNTHQAGKITIWISEIHQEQLVTTPRAYVLPYSRQLHARVEQAIIKTKDGRDQIGFQDRDKRRFRAESDQSLARDDISSVLFIDLEDSALPEK